MTTAVTSRLVLSTAADLLAVPAKHLDDNLFVCDLFALKVVATGGLFTLEVKQYWDSVEKTGSFPMLGVARKGGTEVWSFKTDARVAAGFRGRSRAVAYQGVTYVVFQTTGKNAAVHHVIPLVDLLSQTKTEMTPTQSAMLKQGVAKMLSVSAVLTKDEDEAVSYAVKLIDKQGDLRLEKVTHLPTGRSTYRVVDTEGKKLHDSLGTLAEGRLAIGHIPQAPQTAPGGKTNVPVKVDKPKKDKKAA